MTDRPADTSKEWEGLVDAYVRRLEEEYFAFQNAARKELATLRKDALTLEEARYLLDKEWLLPDVMTKLERIAARSSPSTEAADE